jgi:hypothetical protein
MVGVCSRARVTLWQQPRALFSGQTVLCAACHSLVFFIETSKVRF